MDGAADGCCAPPVLLSARILPGRCPCCAASVVAPGWEPVPAAGAVSHIPCHACPQVLPEHRCPWGVWDGQWMCFVRPWGLSGCWWIPQGGRGVVPTVSLVVFAAERYLVSCFTFLRAQPEGACTLGDPKGIGVRKW